MRDISLDPTNYLIILAYMIVVVGIGFWFSREEKTSEEYLLGGRRIPWWAVGISYKMSITSTVSMVMIPGEIYNNGLTLWMTQLLFPFTALLAFFFCVRFFFKLKVFTPFEYLERRFDSRVRLFVSMIYFWVRLAYLASVLYASAKVFEGAAGWSVWITIPVVAVIGIVYTFLGGLRAVVWTDVLQFIVLYGGLLLGIVICVAGVDGGFVEVLSYSFEHRRGPVHFAQGDFYRFDPYVRLCFWFLLMGVFTDAIFYTTADQITIQRLLSTGTYEEARKAAYAHSLLQIPFTLMLWFVGLAIFTYYGYHADPRVTTGDTALFTFIATEMPTPLPGLLLAAMLAAAMSTLDSGMNSLSTVIVKDFYTKYLNPLATEERVVAMARMLTVAIGVFATIMALSIAASASKLGDSMVETITIWSSFSFLLGPAFFITVTSRKVTKLGIWLGLLAGIGVNSGMITWYVLSRHGWTGAISIAWVLIPLAVAALFFALAFRLKADGGRKAFAAAVPAVLALAYSFSTSFWYLCGRHTEGGELSFQWVTFPGLMALLVTSYSSLFFCDEPEKRKYSGLTLWSEEEPVIDDS